LSERPSTAPLRSTETGRSSPGIRDFESAGFTHIALMQVGGDTQEQFVNWAATELLPHPPNVMTQSTAAVEVAGPVRPTLVLMR
jgi:hypothetical protein